MTQTREMNRRTEDKLNTLIRERKVDSETAAELRRIFSEQRIQNNRDQLTGLWNRSLFEEELEARLVTANLNPHSLALGVVYFDGDRFHDYNNTYGHSQGDLLLRTVGEHLQRIHRSTDMFTGRRGGDEFVAVHPFIFETPEDAERLEKDHFPKIVRRIRDEIAGLRIPKYGGLSSEEEGMLYRPEDGMGYDKATATVGGFLYMPSKKLIRSANDLLNEADRALGLAKKERRGSYKVTASEAQPTRRKQPASV